MNQPKQMKKRKMGNLTVSAIGYGCMGLSHGYGECPPHDECIRLIKKAYELGCTFFDTAEAYGHGDNEKLVGEAVKDILDKVTIATKFHFIGEIKDKELYVREHLKASLNRLGMSYVDVYYVHRLPDFPIEEVAEIMKKLINEKLIKGWGLSQATADIIRRAHKVCPVTCVQNEYSMMERMYEDCIPVCEELGIGFVPFSPLASGFLSGKYSKNDEYKGDDVRRVITRFNKDNVEKNQPLLDYLHKIAKEKNSTPAQISLAWMLKKSPCVVPIPGMRKDERLVENFGAADVELSDEEFKKIEEELKKITIYGNRTDEDIINGLNSVNQLRK